MHAPKRKTLRILRGISRHISKPGHLFFDPCLGTGSTTEAGILEYKRRKFMGCNADSDCVQKMFPSLLVVFAQQVLNKDSYIEQGPEVEAAASKYLKKISTS